MKKKRLVDVLLSIVEVIKKIKNIKIYHMKHQNNFLEKLTKRMIEITNLLLGKL